MTGSSSRPARDALPVSSRRSSTRCLVSFACSLRALTPSGLSFISSAAALRDSWSPRSPGAAAARISSARAASASDRLMVQAAMVSARSPLMVPAAIPASVLRQAGDQGAVALEAGVGVVRGDQQLAGELVGGELARAASGPDPARLRVRERRHPAAAELRDRDRLQERRPGLQPPRRAQRPRQLIIRQSRHVGDGLLGQRRQDRAGPQAVGGLVLGERLAGRLAAEAVRAEHRRQRRRVQVARVAQAQADPRAVALPVLRDPVAARLQVGHPAGHLRVRVEVIHRSAPRQPVPLVIRGGPSARRHAMRFARVVAIIHCGPLPALKAYLLVIRTLYRLYEDQLKIDS